VREMGLAIVTGGSRGLGAALCDEYRTRGWRVVEFSRSAPHDYSVRADLSDTADAARVFSAEIGKLARSEWPEVVAIGSAAVLGPVGSVARASSAAVAAHVDTNVTSGILFAGSFLSAFQAHTCPKTFVNISSGAAIKGHAGWSLYCASKAAMENFVRSLALEQAGREHPIRAFSINPGVMDTAMQVEVRGSQPEDFPEVERYVRLHDDGLLAPAEEVASRIVRIVSSRPEPGGVYSASR